MPRDRLKIDFDDLGLATVLERYQLMVPPNQRSYAWEAPHIQTLLEDLSAAKRRDDPTYFLGTIVLTRGESGEFEVADGQQRLATTAILISAIRDYLYQIGDGAGRAAQKYTDTYLLKYDEREEENIPKLRLNSIDAEFFNRRIVPQPDDPLRDSTIEPTHSSHERLQEAGRLADEHVRKIVAELAPNQRPRELYDWIKFLREDAIVITISVPDHIDAYRMFETLNDRGLKASQTDILKNYLFNLARSRADEAETYWASMLAVIESVGDDELLLDYVRHYWVSRSGPTTEGELAQRIKDRVGSRQQSIDLLKDLDDRAIDYTALLNPLHHPRWFEYDEASKGYLAVITNILGIRQIRPLLLSVTRSFEPAEAKEAFRLFVSWSVRFLIAGGGGGGVLDRHYGLRAKDVTDGVIRSTEELADSMRGIVRSDEAFHAAFQSHRVSKNALARYYLRVLELYYSDEPNPSLGGVDDPNEYNLEHIIPQKPSEHWSIDEGMVKDYYKRIGNLALLSPSVNAMLGNKSFGEKREVFRDSPQLLTQEIAECETWGVAEIEDRQRLLADLAVEAWKL